MTRIYLGKMIRFGMMAIFAAMAMPSRGDAAVMATAVNASQFVGGVAPVVGNQTLDSTGTEVCYRTFCAMASSATRGAIWSAEHVTAAQVAAARGANRHSERFFPDPHLAPQDSAALSDYVRTGYDRGHMAPWADAADPDCFTLADIVPQNPDDNRHLWEGIETAVRELAERYGEVYVVTGPVFQGASIVMLNGRVAVPTGLYKAVYVPALGQAGVYLARNAPGNWWLPLSVTRITELTHTDPFPALPASVKETVGGLVFPNVHGRLVQPNDNSIEADSVGGATPFANGMMTAHGGPVREASAGTVPEPLAAPAQVPSQYADRPAPHPAGAVTVEDYLEKLGFIGGPR